MAETSVYPPDWTSDQRMNLLFAPFRENRDLNPQAWDGKMKFWTKMITDLCKRNRTAVINSKSLPRSFERKGRIPSCLDIVIDQMKRNGQFQDMRSFSADPSWSSWMLDVMVKRPLSWSFNWFVKKPLTKTYCMIFGETNSESGEDLVMLDLLQSISQDILQHHASGIEHESTDSVVSYSHLAHLCHGLYGNEETLHLAVQLLCHQSHCIIIEGDAGEKLISFTKSRECPKAVLTENEKRIYRLKVTEKSVLTELEKLDSSLARLKQEAKDCIKQGDKSQAKVILIKKKKIEKQRQDKENSVEQMQQLITMIQQADVNKKIIDAFKSGKEAFSDVQQRHGLTRENIDNVMDGVQEAFDEHVEINESISQPIAADDIDITQDELEDELNEILAETRTPGKVRGPQSSQPRQELVNTMCKMRLAVDDDLTLPDVPTHDPVPQFSTSSAKTRDPMLH